MSDTTHLSLYEDKVFELQVIFDDYEGRIAAAEQEMSIAVIMIWISKYDYK